MSIYEGPRADQVAAFERDRVIFLLRNRPALEISSAGPRISRLWSLNRRIPLVFPVQHLPHVHGAESGSDAEERVGYGAIVTASDQDRGRDHHHHGAAEKG